MDRRNSIETISLREKQNNNDIFTKSNQDTIFHIEKQQIHSQKDSQNKKIDIRPNQLCTVNIDCQQFKNKKKTKLIN